MQPFVISFCQHLRPAQGDAHVLRREWSAALGWRGGKRDGESRSLQRLGRASVRPASGWTSDRWPVSLGLFWARTLWCQRVRPGAPMLAPQPLLVGHLPLAGPRPSLQGGHSRPARADYKEADGCRIMGLGAVRPRWIGHWPCSLCICLSQPVGEAPGDLKGPCAPCLRPGQAHFPVQKEGSAMMATRAHGASPGS